MTLINFSETNAVVTGASGGIGRAITIALAQAGVERLLVHYCKNESGAHDTAEAARSAGADAVVVQADLRESDQISALADVAFQQLGVVHSWINNAGADVLTGQASEMDFDAKIRLLMDVDVLGTISLSRAVGERMARQPTQHPTAMTFIGWDQAPKGMEGDAGQMFGPVKSAVMAFAAGLAQSLAPSVRVNTIAPGWIQTKWGESTSEYWDQRARGQALMNRWGRPEDVAQAVAFASAPSNTFLTGQVIEVNGGWNRRYS